MQDDTKEPLHARRSSVQTIAAHLEMRHLRYFRAVAQELNFTRAADRLHIAQPPLSQQVRQLEDELGVRLLERDARPLRLTAAGAVMLECATRIMDTLDAAVLEVGRIARGQTGTIRLGFAGSAMYSVLPDIINTYRDLYPDVSLVLQELLAAQIEAALEEGVIDVGFSRPGLPPSPTLRQRPLLTEPLLVAASARHPFANVPSIPVEALHGQTAVMYPEYPTPSLTHLVMQTLGRHGVALQLVQETSDIHTALGLVAAGAGISLVPASVAAIKRSGIVFVPITPQILNSPMTVAWRADSDAAPAARFLEVVFDPDKPWHAVMS